MSQILGHIALVCSVGKRDTLSKSVHEVEASSKGIQRSDLPGQEIVRNVVYYSCWPRRDYSANFRRLTPLGALYNVMLKLEELGKPG